MMSRRGKFPSFRAFSEFPLRLPLLVPLIAACFALAACAPKVSLFADYRRPLEEFTLAGEGNDKVVMIPVRGVIFNRPEEGLFRSSPGLVQEVVSHLRKAAEDKHVKALILLIDSPGGTITASDVLYREIIGFKKKTGVKVITMMMEVAASGGYYIASASDFIVAHPTTITGSIGTVMIRPNIAGLMGKIGVSVEVTKSGEFKDMGSPFRVPTDEEREILRRLIDRMQDRFIQVVSDGRGMEPAKVRTIADGRIYSGDQALELGLVDRLGYVEDALAEARKLAGLPKDARAVVYRRSEDPNDNYYNPVTAEQAGSPVNMSLIGLPEALRELRAGLYYLWIPWIDQ